MESTGFMNALASAAAPAPARKRKRVVTAAGKVSDTFEGLCGREAYVPIFQVAPNPLKFGMPTLFVLKNVRFSFQEDRKIAKSPSFFFSICIQTM